MVKDELLVQVGALASNTGNVNTPSYRRVGVPFFSVVRSSLKDASKGMSDKRLIVIDTLPPICPNGNNAAIEGELAAPQEQYPSSKSLSSITATPTNAHCRR